MHDELHMEYRKRGGKVTLIMGGNALKAYKDVLKKEEMVTESLFTAEAYEVWAERLRTVLHKLLS